VHRVSPEIFLSVFYSSVVRLLYKGETADFWDYKSQRSTITIQKIPGVRSQSQKSWEYNHNPEVRIKSSEYDESFASKYGILAVAVVNRASTIERSSCDVKKHGRAHSMHNKRCVAVGTVLQCVKDLWEIFVTLNS
jgi:hypothetical protein